MRHRIFFCTCPRTGSRDSHTCVANYTYYSWNICGKFKHRLRRESFRFQRRAEIKRFILARTTFNLHFSPKIRHILSPCDNCDIKKGRKRVKKVGQPWLILTVQLLFLFAIFGCVSGQRTSCLSLSLFRFQCSPKKIGPRQAEKNEKASSLYSLRQSTIAEKMKRCVPLRRNVAE